MNGMIKEDIKKIADMPLEWEKLKDTNLLISGASGMIGSFFIDTVMYKNKRDNLGCKIYAVGRNAEKAKERFSEYWGKEEFNFVAQDICKPLKMDNDIQMDYVLHLASNTHPLAYANDPIGTVTTNIIGTNNLLEFASEHNAKRFIFASSVEVYGENKGDVEYFDEDYCGYINCNTMRAGYPESKRCGESLCQAFIRQKGLDVVIPRFARTYGPTMLMSDTKAISQFIKNGLDKKDIVLKSEGKQLYSYTYVADAVFGLLTVLFRGECGNAYNVADKDGDIALRDLAKLIADSVGTKVIFEIPDAVERSGYSTATKAIMSGEKIKTLGWKMNFDMKSGIERTLKILAD